MNEPHCQLRSVVHPNTGIVFGALLCLCAFGGRPACAEPELPLEKRPYRVKVMVAFDRSAALAAPVREEMVEEFRQVAARSTGRHWDLAVSRDDRLFPAGPAGLERLTPRDVDLDAEAPFDKTVRLAVETVGAGYRISGREWDRRTRDFSTVVVEGAQQRRELPETMFRVVQTVFRPVLRIERADADEVILRVQGGVYPAADPGAAPIREGDIVQPLFRYLGRDRRVKQIQYLPWTYLVVRSVEGDRVRALLVTGLRNPLAGGRRRLVEVLAVRIRPHLQKTQLRLVQRADPSKPLAGYKVSVVARTRRNEEPKAPPRKLITGRDGSMEIAAVADQPVVWLLVHSGQWLLARVPFVPGVDSSATIELPDDSLRLEVEGKTDQLLNRLVDTVARRAVLIARARTLAREGDWENVDRQLKQIDELPGIRDYERRLAVIRAPALQTARRNKNRAAEVNVESICNRVSELIRRYLDPDKVRALREEIQELRKLDEVDKKLAAEEPPT